MTRGSDDDRTQPVADAIPHIVWTYDEHGVVTYFNRQWTAYTGLDLEETLRVGGDTLVHPDDRDELARLFSESRAQGKSVEAWYRLRRKDGAYRWHRAVVVPLDTVDGRVTRWIGTATDADTERNLWNEQKFLAEASRVLGTSLDVTETLRDVAKLVVPGLADWCAIDLLGRDGLLERAAVQHVDADKVALAWDLWKKLPPAPSDPRGVYHVMRTRTPEHFAEIPDELLVASAPNEEMLALFRSLGLRSSMCVPLIARDHVLGAVTLVAAESGRRYGKRDLAFAQEFGVRIAIAVDNARLYTEAQQARTAAEAMAADVIEQSRAVEAALLELRRERDDARAKLTPK